MTERLAQRAAGGMAWMAAGLATRVVFQLVTLGVLARLISPREFGVVGAALIAISAAQILAESGLGPAIVQMRDLRPDHVRVGFTLSVLLGLTFFGALFVAADAVAGFFPDIDGLAPVLRLISLVFVVRNLTLGDFLMLRALRFRALAAVDLVSYALGYGVVAIGLAFQGYGVWAIAWGQVGQEVVRTVSLWIMSPHSAKPQLTIRPIRDLLGYGGGHTLAKAANWLAREGDNFVVGRFLGASALGLYTRAYQLMSMPAYLFGKAADDALFPSMAAVQDDTPRLSRAYLRSVTIIALMAVPVSAVGAILSREVILVLLGPDWLGLKAAFDVMVFGMLFRTSYKMSDSLVRALGAVYRRAWRQGVYALLVVGGAIIGQNWGIHGVAWAVLIAVTINFLLMAHLSLRLLTLPWRAFASAHGPGFILAVCTTAVVWPLSALARSNDLPALVVLVLGCTVAVAAVLVTLRAAPYVPAAGSLAANAQYFVTILPTGGARRAARRVLGRGYGRSVDSIPH